MPCSVCYLARQLLDHLRQKQQTLFEGLKVTPKDDMCVQIAALCHELGKICVIGDITDNTDYTVYRPRSNVTSVPRSVHKQTGQTWTFRSLEGIKVEVNACAM